MERGNIFWRRKERMKRRKNFWRRKVFFEGHMGPEYPSNRKKYPSFFLKPNFRKLQDDSKNVCLKIGSKVP